jgi:hypothetical protein
VGKVKCHHLAFRQKTIDWQIWIQDGDKPLPRKMVITYKRDAGGPQFTARLSRWNVKPKLSKDTFEFEPPADAKKVDLLKVFGSPKGEKEEPKE